MFADNPLTHGSPKTLLPQPCVLVIFGAAGDLSWRKLLPAIYNLNVDGVLPSNFAIVGFGLSGDKTHASSDEYIRDRGSRRHREILSPAAFGGALGRFLAIVVFRGGELQRVRGPTRSSMRSSNRSIRSLESRPAVCFTSRFRRRWCRFACSI